MQRGVGRALEIGVVDAQHQLAAELSGVKPVEQERAGPADVQKAGGGWSETDAGHQGGNGRSQPLGRKPQCNSGSHRPSDRRRRRQSLDPTCEFELLPVATPAAPRPNRRRRPGSARPRRPLPSAQRRLAPPPSLFPPFSAAASPPSPFLPWWVLSWANRPWRPIRQKAFEAADPGVDAGKGRLGGGVVDWIGEAQTLDGDLERRPDLRQAGVAQVLGDQRPQLRLGLRPHGVVGTARQLGAEHGAATRFRRRRVVLRLRKPRDAHRRFGEVVGVPAGVLVAQAAPDRSAASSGTAGRWRR